MNSVIYNFCTHTWITYCVMNNKRREGERMCPLLDENDTAGVNVKIWEGGPVSERGKMLHRDNMSQCGKRDVMKKAGKMSQSGHFVTIQVKKGGRFVTATLCPPSGLGGHKIRGHFVWRQNVTVNVVSIGCCIGWAFCGCQNVTRMYQAWTFLQGPLFPIYL
jgi:hypothetical protein